MKKLMSCVLCILLCIAIVPEALAEGAGGTGSETYLNSKYRDISFETALALKLKELELFEGIGINGEGTDFGLEQQATRVEAVTMLIRVLGKDAEAKVYSKTHPFTDVPAWADGYVSYAYDKGLAKGVSDTLFGAEDKVTAEMYLTLILRTLGYTDKNYVYGDWEGYRSADFSWDLPWALASYCGISPTQLDEKAFLRGDMVDVTCAALYACIKGSSTLLKDKLVKEGVFTAEKFDAAFPQDPFDEYRRINYQISVAIAGKEKLGQLEYDKYSSECHLIFDIYQEDGVITVKTLVFDFDADFTKDNAIGSNGGGAGPWVIKLKADTLECLECYTSRELAAQGMSWEDILPGKSQHASYLTQGMNRVCRMETQMLLDKGVIGYRQPTYEEALARMSSYCDQINQVIETVQCTILTGSRSTAHGGAAIISLIYKPGSAVGEGNIISLPVPLESYMGKSSLPKELRLSDDGLTLYYSYHYDEALVFDEGTKSERIAHEAGTYYYTVDLNTGETSLSIVKS